MNDGDYFTFPIVSLIDIDEREIISNIKEKVKEQKSITDEELIELALTPIMVKGRENIIKQFEETSEVMDMVSYDNIEIKESTYGIALMLANMYFERDDPVRKKIQRDFMVKIDCIDEAIQESYEKGTNYGMEKV